MTPPTVGGVASMRKPSDSHSFVKPTPSRARSIVAYWAPWTSVGTGIATEDERPASMKAGGVASTTGVTPSASVRCAIAMAWLAMPEPPSWKLAQLAPAGEQLDRRERVHPARVLAVTPSPSHTVPLSGGRASARPSPSHTVPLSGGRASARNPSWSFGARGGECATRPAWQVKASVWRGAHSRRERWCVRAAGRT